MEFLKKPKARSHNMDKNLSEDVYKLEYHRLLRARGIHSLSNDNTEPVLLLNFISTLNERVIGSLKIK